MCERKRNDNATPEELCRKKGCRNIAHGGSQQGITVLDFRETMTEANSTPMAPTKGASECRLKDAVNAEDEVTPFSKYT